MQFAEFKGEKKLADLVDRLYQIRGPRARVSVRDAEDALLRANPHLRDIRNVPKGTLIVVPKLPGVRSAEEVRPVEESVGKLVREVRRAVADYRRAVEATTTHQVERAKATHNLLRSAKLKRHAERVPVLKERLPRMTEEAKARRERVEELKETQKRALAQLLRDMGRFARRFG